MITIPSPEYRLKNLKQVVLLVLFICYIPHIATEPWWLFTFFLSAIGYRLIADYYHYPRLSTWLIVLLILGCLSLLYGSTISIEFYVRCFLIFIIFKCLEIYTLRDIKVMVMCNFYLIFSSLIIVQELWIVLYLLIAIFANLAIMLKLSASAVTLKQISGKSSKQLLLAIPISILLFFVFPRIVPHWSVPAQGQAAMGFSESMNPGSIAQLFNDDTIAMQINFKKAPVLNGYWRGVILSFYNGRSWNATWYNYFKSQRLPELDVNDTADYEIILEANQKKLLFYEGYPLAATPNLIFSANHWLARQNREPITERFIYSLKVQREPYHELTPSEYAEATQLPKNSNPHLKSWAIDQFAQSQKNVKTFIIFLHNYIQQQSFWYTLTPPRLDDEKNQMDSFWFNTQKGFCEHYAGAVTFILRAAGIPARVVLGYYGGQWNPISNEITIQQNNAHAWLEYWQAGSGWQQLDPTSFIAPERVDKVIQDRENLQRQEDDLNISALPFGRKLQLYYESFRYFSERWLIYYNPSSQQTLLHNIGFGQWNTGQLIQAFVSCLMVFFLTLGIFYHWLQKRSRDPLLVEYHLLQKEFRRFNLLTLPSDTLKQQCTALIDKIPILTPDISTFFSHYEQLRLRESVSDSKHNVKKTIALFKNLRRILRQHKNFKQ